MRRPPPRMPWLAAACALWATAATSSSVELQSRFAPSEPMTWLRTDKQAGPCTVRIGWVHDLRIDPTVMGDMFGRTVQMNDSVAWMRSGLAALAGDQRLKLATDSAAADLTLNVDIVKAYIAAVTVDKVTAIVVRLAIESNKGGHVQQTLRGSDTDVNWINGSGEMQSAFDRAMAGLIRQIDLAALDACAAS